MAISESKAEKDWLSCMNIETSAAASRTSASSKRLAGTIGIGLSTIFAALQFFLMRQFAEMKILPGSPMGMDQVVYLFEVYQAAILGEASGFMKGLATLLSDPPAAGIALQATAYAIMMVSGISRIGALAANFLYFAAVPGLISLIIGRDKPVGAHLFIWGFWLSVQSMYGLVGGPFDFRLDFAGMSLFAIACALLWRTDAFTNPGPSVLVGLVTIWLCFTRFITAVHLAVAGAFLLIALLMLPTLRATRSKWKGITIAAAVAGAGIAPYVVSQWDRLWGYYVVGHVIGPEKQVRATMQNLSGWRDALAFYPRSLIHNQLGLVGAWLLVATLAIAATIGAFYLLQERLRGEPVTPAFSRSALWAIVVVAASALGPSISLNADILKSNVVANVFIVPAGGLGILAFLLTGDLLRRIIGARNAGRVTLGLGALAFATGLTYQLTALARPTLITEHRADFAARDQMLTLITETSIANGWRMPLLFVDHVGDLDGLQMELSHFEKYGTDLQTQRLLAQIEEVPPDQLWPSLLKADILIIRDPSATEIGPYPFDRQMARLNAQLHEFCAARCQKLGSFTYFGTPMTLYRRATGPIPPTWRPVAPIAAISDPPGFSDELYEASGLSSDGWINREASFTFHLAPPLRNAVAVVGQIPGPPPNGVKSETIRLSVNGRPVIEQEIAAGDFTLRVDLAPVEGEVRLTIEGSDSFPLRRPDTRSGSLRLRSIQWKAENGSN